MVNFEDLLRLCDEQRYTRDGPEDAYDNLVAAVKREPERAREKMENLHGCRRTVMRHREFLWRALRE